MAKIGIFEALFLWKEDIIIIKDFIFNPIKKHTGNFLNRIKKSPRLVYLFLVCVLAVTLFFTDLLFFACQIFIPSIDLKKGFTLINMLSLGIIFLFGAIFIAWIYHLVFNFRVFNVYLDKFNISAYLVTAICLFSLLLHFILIFWLNVSVTMSRLLGFVLELWLLILWISILLKNININTDFKLIDFNQPEI